MESNLITKKDDFVCGVVEGFYGRPWTPEQRADLFKKMKKWGMNTYLYAPKDDRKHRAYWRELYTVEEADHLSTLITSAKENNLQFVYAISPGLDMKYSSVEDVNTLKRKLEQVNQLGCEGFAILFDDIEQEMSKADKDMFNSFAHAQVSVTNEIHQHMNSKKFMFCPTQYCATRAVPNVRASEYLITIGSKLDANIDVMWTGPQVISKDLPIEAIDEIAEVLRRPPLIWDNLHANDYDQKRVFLGPYSGRSALIIPRLRGVLTNPNCEYWTNVVAIHTLAQWSRCSEDANKDEKINPDAKLETESTANGNREPVPENLEVHVYHPVTAYRAAVQEWLEDFKKAISVWGRGPNSSVSSREENLLEDDQMSITPNQELTSEDLQLICDLFYLPFEHGAQGLQLIHEIRWLQANANLVTGISETDKSKPEVAEWFERANKFSEVAKNVSRVCKILNDIPNRELLYELIPYTSDMKVIVSRINSYIKWLGFSNGWQEAFMSKDHEPWVILGGLAAELQKLIPLYRDPDLHQDVALGTQTYTIRPYRRTDDSAVYKVCTLIYKDGLSAADDFVRFPELPGDVTIGGYLSLCQEVSFVVEDGNEVIVGVAVAALNAKEFRSNLKVSWIETLRKKYQTAIESDSQYMKDVISSLHTDLPEIPEDVLTNHPVELKLVLLYPLMDPSVPKRLITCMFATLQAKGVSGCFIEVHKNENCFMELFKMLGFTELCTNYLGQQF